ncbi:hypothetical protein MD484_g1006, partial [Candolleomyces efflorescens]
MLARVFSLIAISSVFLAATAVPTPGGKGGDVSQCNGGTVQCCNEYHEKETEDESVKGLLSLLHINLDGVEGMIGMNCSPVSAVAIGNGASCSTQQVCCQDNKYNGLINVGCSPINIAL